MDFNFIKLESEDSSDDCEVEVLYHKKMPIKRPAFGGHLSTQQTNIRNLEESKRRKLTDSKRSESQGKTKVTAQEKKGDLQIVKEVCSVNSNKKEQKGKATSGLQNNLCSGKKKVVTRKNGGLDMANRGPRIKNEISKKTKTRVQNPVSKKRKAPNSRTPVKPKKLNSAEGSKGNVPKKILCKRIVGGAKKKQQIVKSLKTDHEKNEVVIIEPSFPHPRYSVSDASTSASLISTALKPTASTSATSASASSTSASAASTASEYAASISTIIANCPNLVNTRVVTIKEEKNDVSFYKENLRAWCDEEVVAEITAVDIYVVKNVIDLFNQECTIPFIARYRGEKVGNLQGNKLREIQESYDNIKAVRKKVDSVLKTLEKQNKLNEATALALLNAKTLSDVDHLLIPFKSGTARTLAERARKLGLEEWALKLMKGTVSISQLDFRNLVKNNVKDLSTSSKVCDGIQHIIADVIAKDRELLDYIRQISKVKTIRISSKKSAVAEKKDRRAYVETGKIRDHKFELYYQFDTSLDNIKPHQVMAINRGENLKKLIVRVNIPSELIHKTHQMCWNKFFSGKALDYESEKFLKKCIDDAYVRLLEPHLVRNIRSELTKKAQKECIDAFCSNLKNLLLTPPIRGKNVLGVDPGFKEGCKLAVVSSVGDLLDTDIIYPHLVNNTNDIGKVKRLITTHMVSAIAIGNGIGCREAEKWMSNLIKNNVFSPIEVKYCIISEQGVSIYSVSKEAEMEFPYLHPIFRSAVAIARRLQDPLSEYVKLDPKNLGVGMYQHDIPDPLLKAALNETIIECVSFVGVDLNICSEVLLRNVAGLSAKKAKSIIEWREKNGPFINRQQLLDVKGLGRKSFEQCAGFVKIFSETSRCSRSSYKNLADEAIQSQSSKVAPTENPLDMTIIHPESYNVAVGFLCKLNCKLDEIGKPSLSDKIRSYMESSDVSIMAYNFGINVQGMQLIIDALIKPVKFDIRSEFDKPLFRSSATSIEDLKLNDTLTGQVTNVTRFGAFVDIGVGVSSLLHKSQIRNQVVKLGDNITVKVIALDLCKMRINLTLAHQEQ